MAARKQDVERMLQAYRFSASDVARAIVAASHFGHLAVVERLLQEWLVLADYDV